MTFRVAFILSASIVAVFGAEVCPVADQEKLQEERALRVVNSCGVKRLGVARWAKGCIKNELGISESCSSCFGDFVACGRQKCAMTCLSGAFSSFSFDNAACGECMMEKCVPHLEKCTNLPESALPRGVSWPPVGSVKPSLPPSLPLPKSGEGACVSPSDFQLWTKSPEIGRKFSDNLKTCGYRSFGTLSLFKSCISGLSPSLSEGCTRCFGEQVSCSAKHCMIPCLGGAASDACVECSTKNCLLDMYHCSGLTSPEMLPPAPNGKVYYPPGWDPEKMETRPEDSFEQSVSLPPLRLAKTRLQPSNENCYRTPLAAADSLDVYFAFWPAQVEGGRKRGPTLDFYIYLHIPGVFVDDPEIVFGCPGLSYYLEGNDVRFDMSLPENKCAQDVADHFNMHFRRRAEADGSVAQVLRDLKGELGGKGSMAESVTIDFIVPTVMEYTDKCSGHKVDMPRRGWRYDVSLPPSGVFSIEEPLADVRVDFRGLTFSIFAELDGGVDGLRPSEEPLVFACDDGKFEVSEANGITVVASPGSCVEELMSRFGSDAPLLEHDQKKDALKFQLSSTAVPFVLLPSHRRMPREMKQIVRKFMEGEGGEGGGGRERRAKSSRWKRGSFY